jgi:hypothetical protein
VEAVETRLGRCFECFEIVPRAGLENNFGNSTQPVAPSPNLRLQIRAAAGSTTSASVATAVLQQPTPWLTLAVDDVKLARGPQLASPSHLPGLRTRPGLPSGSVPSGPARAQTCLSYLCNSHRGESTHPIPRVQRQAGQGSPPQYRLRPPVSAWRHLPTGPKSSAPRRYILYFSSCIPLPSHTSQAPHLFVLPSTTRPAARLPLP